MAWRQVEAAAAPCARSSHAVVAVPASSSSPSSLSNRLVVFGGEDGPRRPIDNVSVHVLDLSSPESSASLTWSAVSVQSGPSVLGHAAAAVGARVFVFGGRRGGALGKGQETEALYAFDLATGEWSQPSTSGTPPEARSYHCMTTIGTNVYVFGGCGNRGRLADIHCLDTDTMTWASLIPEGDSPAPIGRGGSTLVGLKKRHVGDDDNNSGDLLYVLYGFCGKQLGDTWVYDTSTRRWEELQCTGQAPPARSVLGAGLLSGERVFVFAGEQEASAVGHEGAGNYFNDSYVLHIKTREWTKVHDGTSPAPSPRGWFDMAVLDGDRVFVFGGLSPTNERLGDAWLFIGL